MSDAQHELSPVSVLKSYQHRASLGIPTRFLPEFGWVHRWHPHLLSTNGVHLSAHDVFNLLEHSPPKRQIAIDASGQLANHPCSQEQLVAYHLCFCRHLTQRVTKEL
jgi:hypothetical protein